jgi:hypothetical protein
MLCLLVDLCDLHQCGNLQNRALTELFMLSLAGYDNDSSVSSEYTRNNL